VNPGQGGPSIADVEVLVRRLDREAEAAGYHLNPNKAFTLGLVEGLLVNEKRYGYWACPCRLATGLRGEDLDIICPCDYRDPDLSAHGACYCALYVSAEVLAGTRRPAKVPERRPAERGSGGSRGASPPGAPRPGAGVQGSGPSGLGGLPYPLWRCRVCGYLCAREEPPGTCPICKATKDRFERFL
jgi:ferredoxin-thioredoxin reductase catalytic subunit